VRDALEHTFSKAQAKLSNLLEFSSLRLLRCRLHTGQLLPTSSHDCKQSRWNVWPHCVVTSLLPSASSKQIVQISFIRDAAAADAPSSDSSAVASAATFCFFVLFSSCSVLWVCMGMVATVSSGAIILRSSSGVGKFSLPHPETSNIHPSKTTRQQRSV
jgi:hypothetical protein